MHRKLTRYPDIKAAVLSGFDAGLLSSLQAAIAGQWDRPNKPKAACAWNAIPCASVTRQFTDMRTQRMGVLRSFTSTCRAIAAPVGSAERASSMEANFLKNWPSSTARKPLETVFSSATGNAIWSCSARSLARPMSRHWSNELAALQSFLRTLTVARQHMQNMCERGAVETCHGRPD